MLSGQDHGDSAQPLTVSSAAAAIEEWISDDELEDSPSEEAKPKAKEPAEAEEAEDQGDDEPGESDEDEDEADLPSDEESEVAEDSDDETPQQPQKFKVKVNDREEEVTLEEALAGYSRTQDYTRKTQLTAEEKKLALAEKQAASVERQRVHAIANQLESTLSGLVTEPDWDKLRTEDPNLFAQVHAQWQLHKDRLAEISNLRREQEEQLANEAREQFNQHVIAEREKLHEVIPAWKNPDVGKKERGELLEYARDLGFSDSELGDVIDHRAIVALRKAMLYDRAEKAKSLVKQEVQKKIEKVKVAAPGSANSKRPKTTELTRRKQRLAKTGTVKDATSAIELWLGEDD